MGVLMWIILFINYRCPTGHSYQMKWTLFNPICNLNMANETKKNIPCFFMQEGTHCLRWVYECAWQKTSDSYISDQRGLKSDHYTHVVTHADLLSTLFDTTQGDCVAENLTQRKMSYESTVSDEPYPGRRFIFFFLVCTVADVLAYVFLRYPDAAAKHLYA